MSPLPCRRLLSQKLLQILDGHALQSGILLVCDDLADALLLGVGFCLGRCRGLFTLLGLEDELDKFDLDVQIRVFCAAGGHQGLFVAHLLILLQRLEHTVELGRRQIPQILDRNLAVVGEAVLLSGSDCEHIIGHFFISSLKFDLHNSFCGAFDLDDQVVALRGAESDAGKLVLHGGSGLADDDFRRAVQEGICKVNIFTDIDKAGKAGIEAGLAAGEKTMMGLIPLQSGRITADGQDIEKKRSRIFYYESFEWLDGNLNGRDYLTFVQSMWHSEVSVQIVIDYWEMNDFIDVPIRKYSLGMKQRLIIAMYFVSGAKYLIMDEITNALDEANRQKLFQSLKTMRDKGRMILLSSHYKEEIQEICDVMLTMRDWSKYENY